jgi:FMN phosphatase YigB (HAD superfamily)
LQSDESVSVIPFPGSEIRLVTVDFWDTLVMRTRPADSAKLATASRIARETDTPITAMEVFGRRVQIEAELSKSSEHGEYQISDVIQLLLESLIDQVEPERVAELVWAEIGDECRYTRLNPSVALFLNDVRHGSGERSVAVLSDFYMNGSALRKILEHHGIDCEGLHFVSSCDHSASKRSGELYGLVHRTFGVAPSEHFHVGDNEFSDVEMAKRVGVHAHFLPARREFPGPGELSGKWFESNPFDEDCRRIGSLLAGDPKRSLSTKRSLFAGSRSAFLPVALVFAAVLRARERGLDRVFYVSREGAFLSELHRRISDEHPELRFPSAVHLEVSRRSTFGASLLRLDGPSLERLWSQYPHQSIAGLLSSLGVEPADVENGIRRFGLDPDEVLHEIRSNSRVREFLADTEVESAIMRSLRNQRELLVRYLRDRGVTADQALVVDLGWRGTIQDNFAHIMTGVHFHGVYMGLFPYLNRQPVNVSKEALAFDGNLGDSYDHVSPPAVLESPLTPNIPSAVRYRLHPDGRVLVITQTEAGRADDLISSFQEGVRSATPFLMDHFIANGYDFELLSKASKIVLRRYFIEPDPGVADIWFNSAHDDTFGAMNNTPFGKGFDPSTIIRAKGDLTKIPHALESGWPSGYMQWLPVHSIATQSALRTLYGS